jgi:heme/copper-type cytochrome/quinol oxidase subunit 2
MRYPRFLALLLLPALVATARAGDLGEEPRAIAITARRFEFVPSTITLKKGETVKLFVTSEEVTHGFFFRLLKIDTDVVPGETRQITVTPQSAGTFTANYLLQMPRWDRRLRIVLDWTVALFFRPDITKIDLTAGSKG